MHGVLVEFEAPSFFCVPELQYIAFLFEIWCHFPTKSAPFPKNSVTPYDFTCNSKELYSAAYMLPSQEEEADFINAYIPCAFPGCLRYFRTNGGLTKHQRVIHPNWTLQEEEGQSLDSEHL